MLIASKIITAYKEYLQKITAYKVGNGRDNSRKEQTLHKANE